MNYAPVRDEIKTQLEAVTGIGQVFNHRRHASDWAQFLSLFKTAGGLINMCWISRAEDTEQPEVSPGSTDEADEILAVAEEEAWEIELFYGFKDDDDAGSPSEFGFHLLEDAIETKFRFLQNLNGTVEKSWPLNRVNSSFGTLGEVHCHRALWRLRLRQRIVNPT